MRSLLVILPILAGVAIGTIVQGAKPDRIKAPHPVHAKNEVTCETCHDAAQSKAGTDNLLPAMETCKSCHDIDDESKCGQCHANPLAPAAAPRINTTVQKFGHETHIAKGIQCATCHGQTDKAEPVIPAMSVCRTCHETASALADCRVCHAPRERLHPESHVKGWVSFHAADARPNQAECRTCHTETDCQSCHSGDNVRPRTHRLNFAFDHALEARGNEIDCASCHEDRGFCAACHLAERVLPTNHSRADWVLAKDGGRHAEEGRFDLESCAACHDTGTNAPLCADCHGR